MLDQYFVNYISLLEEKSIHNLLIQQILKQMKNLKIHYSYLV
jgi:hypothetical protein